MDGRLSEEMRTKRYEAGMGNGEDGCAPGDEADVM